MDKLANCNQRDLFREIERMTKGKRQAVLPKTPVESSESLADLFADYFTNKIIDLRLTLDCPSTPLSVVLEDRDCLVKFEEFTTVSLDQVRSVIMNSPTKTCCLDPIPTILLKKCLDVLLAPITAITLITAHRSGLYMRYISTLLLLLLLLSIHP
jgi:hypothetical protein